MYFVRTASERDLEKVRALLVETWHATYDAFLGAAGVEALIARLLSPAGLRERLRARDSEFLVADDGRTLGGMAYARMPEGSKTVELQFLYVRPAAQRQGIGRNLFAELETCFPEAELMRLEVELANAGAIAFYAAHGFIEAGRVENAGPGESGLPALVMEKPLAH